MTILSTCMVGGSVNVNQDDVEYFVGDHTIRKRSVTLKLISVYTMQRYTALGSCRINEEKTDAHPSASVGECIKDVGHRHLLHV